MVSHGVSWYLMMSHGVLWCQILCYGVPWVGHLWLKWAEQVWQSEFFGGDILKKTNTGFQGSTLSGHHMTTGFGPFELPTHGLLQKGWDHSLPKACFE